MTRQERDRARYATDEYRAWNRERMREVRTDSRYVMAENAIQGTRRRAGNELADGPSLMSPQWAGDDFWAQSVERGRERMRGRYAEARDPENRTEYQKRLDLIDHALPRLRPLRAVL
jgi:hypothetical protein